MLGLALWAGVLVGATPPLRSVWVVDVAHSQIGFAVDHLGISQVRGRFTRFEGRLELDGKHPDRSRVAIMVEASSIATDNPKRDAHLRSPDFFDAQRFPHLTFASDRVVGRGPHRYDVHGRLSIRGRVQPVVLTVTLTQPVLHPETGTRVRAASTRTTIDRTDYGLTWNRALEAGGWLVGREVDLDLSLELVELERP
ncbi:MAG: YceI family protein [Myxococcota bacterium]